MLRKNYGCVRVDFNQPFSLKVGELKVTIQYNLNYTTTVIMIVDFVEKLKMLQSFNRKTATFWFFNICIAKKSKVRKISTEKIIHLAS